MFRCTFPGCGLSYRRKEHLTRHARRHYQSDSFECPFCDRQFARNDTLRQHVRIHHNDKELQPGRTLRACNYCRSRKSKCDGQTPCAACAHRGIDCSFTPSTKDHGDEQAHSTARASVDSTSLTPLSTSDALGNSPYRAAPYIQLFFDRFHPTWPFLHRGSFNPDLEPAVLLQSIVMIGLWLSGDESARGAAMDLHSQLLVSIEQQQNNWAALSPPSNPNHWPMATYQGILLQIIFALLTGNEQNLKLNLQLTQELPTLPGQLLTALVHTCLNRKMFFYPTIVDQFKPTLPWVFIWLGIEEVKRLALSLYKVCRSCQVVPNTDDGQREDHRLLSLEDMQFALPEGDELWHANSNLAVRLGEVRDAYLERNREENWICQTARLLQPVGEFSWF